MLHTISRQHGGKKKTTQYGSKNMSREVKPGSESSSTQLSPPHTITLPPQILLLDGGKTKGLKQLWDPSMGNVEISLFACYIKLSEDTVQDDNITQHMLHEKISKPTYEAGPCPEDSTIHICKWRTEKPYQSTYQLCSLQKAALICCTLWNAH